MRGPLGSVQRLGEPGYSGPYLDMIFPETSHGSRSVLAIASIPRACRFLCSFTIDRLDTGKLPPLPPLCGLTKQGLGTVMGEHNLVRVF